LADGIHEAVRDAIAFVSSRLHPSFCIVPLDDHAYWSLQQQGAAQLQRAMELLKRDRWAAAASCCIAARKTLTPNGTLPQELCILFCQLSYALASAYMQVGCLDEAFDVATSASALLYKAAVDQPLREKLIELTKAIDVVEEPQQGPLAACGVRCRSDTVVAQHTRRCKKCRCLFPQPDGSIPPIRARLHRLGSVLSPNASANAQFEATARLLGGGVSTDDVRAVVYNERADMPAVHGRFREKVRFVSSLLPGICHAYVRPGAAADSLPFDITLLSTHVQSPFLMVQAPVNSTGDLYHQIAYIFWCRAAYAVPCRVVLCKDDTKTTTEAATRALRFVEQLSLNEYFEVRTVEGAGFQPAARQVKAELALQNRSYVDHRLATTTLSDAVMRYGYGNVTGVLRRGFSKHRAGRFQQYPALRTYVEECMTVLHNALEHNARQLVVLHYRTSNGADGGQQAFATHAPQIVQQCEAAGFAVAVIYVDDRKNPQDLVHVVAHMRPFQDERVSHAPLHDLGKLAHLGLLLALYENRSRLRLAGIVGNTSGTLDLAALIGLPVLNFHNFAGQVQTSVDYQAYRLMMQALWMRPRATVEMQGGRGSALLSTWLALPEANKLSGTLPGSPQTVQLAPGQGGLSQRGFYLLFCFHHSSDIDACGWRVLPDQSFRPLKRHIDKHFMDQGLLTAPIPVPHPNAHFNWNG